VCVVQLVDTVEHMCDQGLYSFEHMLYSRTCVRFEHLIDPVVPDVMSVVPVRQGSSTGATSRSG
jgi:hypothetical protein